MRYKEAYSQNKEFYPFKQIPQKAIKTVWTTLSLVAKVGTASRVNKIQGSKKEILLSG